MLTAQRERGWAPLLLRHCRVVLFAVWFVCIHICNCQRRDGEVCHWSALQRLEVNTYQVQPISVFTLSCWLIKVLRLRTFITKQQSKSIQRLTPYNSWPKPNDTLSPPTNMCNAALIWFQLLPLTSDRKHLKCFFFDFSQRELRFADTNFF